MILSVATVVLKNWTTVISPALPAVYVEVGSSPLAHRSGVLLVHATVCDEPLLYCSSRMYYPPASIFESLMSMVVVVEVESKSISCWLPLSQSIETVPVSSY